MDIIEQIEIKNFRSFGNRTGETTKLVKIKPLNILSGSNDSGKSNILRALNLFFNGNTDLNEFFDFRRDYFRKEKYDEKDIKEELVTIKIWFSNQKNKDKNLKNDKKVFLPEKFWVSKKLKKNSVYSQFQLKSNVELSFKHEKYQKGEKTYNYFLENGTLKSMVKASLAKQLTEFVNQIQYHYIPAIKSRTYFSHLFGELQQTLWKAKVSAIDQKKNDFVNEIQVETQNLMEEFKSTINQKISSYEPVFQLPENLVDLFRTLQVQTGHVDLTQRGDGVQAKLIPEILNFIAIKEKSYTTMKVRKDVQSKKYFIWGFEEPENSYEYSNAQLLADRFKNKFIENAQIFVSTHSFNFLSIQSENVSKYRVWKDSNIASSRISRIDLDKDGDYVSDDYHLTNSYRLSKELGVFHLNSSLERLFMDTELLKARLDEKLQKIKRKKAYMLVEDEYDQIYKIALLKLNDIKFNLKEIEDKFKQNSGFEILAMKSANAVTGLLRSQNADIHKDSKIVGLYDFDKAGSECFNHLKKDKFWDSQVYGEKQNGFYRRRSDHKCFYGMLLPVPDCNLPKYHRINRHFSTKLTSSINFYL